MDALMHGGSERRSALVCVAAAALVLAASGCSDSGAPDDQVEPGAPATLAPATDLTLSITAKLGPRPQPTSDEDELVEGPPGGDGLEIAYTVINTGTTPQLVNDRIPVEDGSASGSGDEVDPIKAFVLPGPDGVVDVVKRTFLPESAPAGPDFTVTYQATVVPAGATVRGRAYVPLPFTRDLPDFATGPGRDAPLPAAPTGWRLCLGVTPSVYEPDVLPGGKYALIGNATYAPERQQRILCSQPEPLPTGPAT